MELERRLAAFKQTEAAVVFQSGFTANAGTVSSLLGRDDVIVSDELNHASIIDGARLSRATIKVFPHRDAAAARADRGGAAARRSGRSSSPTASSAWTATSARCRRCATWPTNTAAIMMVDDAHASGVFGRQRARHGRSLRPARPRARAGRHAVEGDRRARRLRGRVAGAHRVPAPPRAAVPVLDVASAVGHGHLPRRARRARVRAAAGIERLWDNTRFFKAGLAALGFDTGAQREPDHAGHRRRRRRWPCALGSAVRARRVRAGHRLSRPCRRARPACGRSSRRRTRGTSSCSRSTRSPSARSPSSDREPSRRHERPAAAAHRRRTGRFFEAYTQGLSTTDLERLFTRDTPDAYRFFSRDIDFDALQKLPWHRRLVRTTRLLFLAFTLQADARAPRCSTASRSWPRSSA